MSNCQKLVKINGVEYLVIYTLIEFWQDNSFSHNFGVERREEIDKIEVQVKEAWDMEGNNVPIDEEFRKEIENILTELA